MSQRLRKCRIILLCMFVVTVLFGCGALSNGTDNKELVLEKAQEISPDGGDELSQSNTGVEINLETDEVKQQQEPTSEGELGIAKEKVNQDENTEENKLQENTDENTDESAVSQTGSMAYGVVDPVISDLMSKEDLQKYNPTAVNISVVASGKASPILYTGNGTGKIIAVDPGHQSHYNSEKEPIGPGATTMKNKVSSGTAGKASGLAEYQLNLQVALRLRDLLLKNGYQVLMIRETNDVNISNSERAIIANNGHADAFIRIHADGSENSGVAGAMTICQTGNNPFNSQLYSASKKLSKSILDSYTASTGAKWNKIWETDTMSGINWATVPTTILEMGYMSNASEDLRMADALYQEKACEGIVNGFNVYFGQ